MVKTVAEAFNTFRSDLEITNMQQQVISTRRDSVETCLKREWALNGGTFLIGSYPRHTMISPLSESDIDLMVPLDPKYYHEAVTKSEPQAYLLDRIRSTLANSFTQTQKVSRNGQAVTLKFNDFEFDVVPAFERQGGGYVIADSIGKAWISTDPVKHQELISNRNAMRDQYFVPMVKMIKQWNRNNGNQFRSFHLEILALEIFEQRPINTIREGLRDFFFTGEIIINLPCWDPAGYKDNLARYLPGSQIGLTASRLMEKAKNIATTALKHEASSNEQLAIENWRALFGARFPAYG
jgi:hypothetical protein